MRRAFTLIELLVIIGILAAVTGMAAISIRRNQDAVRLRAASRAAFASVRLARSTALVTQQPSVLTFSTVCQGEDGAMQSKIAIDSASLVDSGAPTRGRTLDGDWIDFGGAAEAAEGGEDGAGMSGGESIEDVLFAPVSEETLRDVCIKVVMDSDEDGLAQPNEVDEARISRVSVFSNVDYLLGRYQRKRDADRAAAAAEAEKDDAETDVPAVLDQPEERSIAWQVNGRCEPHRIYVYEAGSKPEDGWHIRVDRFGAAKVYAPGEREDGP